MKAKTRPASFYASVVLLGLVLLFACTVPPPQLAVIKGRVLDSDGNPLAGAIVCLKTTGI